MRLHYEDGALAERGYKLALSAERAGWSFSSLHVLELAAGEQRELDSGEEELAVLPLAGSCELAGGGGSFSLAGRRDVFSGPTDWCYVPRGAAFSVSSASGGRFALAGARTDRARHFERHDVLDAAVELRGAGSCSRRVTNYCMADGLAERLLVCEVVTPAGNWSSYPPHKHDEQREDERELEELYYFEVASGPGGEPGVAYQRLYGTKDRPIDLLAEVRSGDVVVIPYGYHGPSMAAPGYDLYYLNVMAGPGERRWMASDDPAHAWIRQSWSTQQVDARLTSKARLGGR